MYAIGQVRIESRQNILDLPEVFIPAEETAFVVSNGFIVEEDGHTRSCASPRLVGMRTRLRLTAAQCWWSTSRITSSAGSCL